MDAVDAVIYAPPAPPLYPARVGQEVRVVATHQRDHTDYATGRRFRDDALFPLVIRFERDGFMGIAEPKELKE